MKSQATADTPNMAQHQRIGSFVENPMPHLESEPASTITYPSACRACEQLEVVPISLKPAKDEPGTHVIYMLCRACHHRWQEAVTIDTDI